MFRSAWLIASCSVLAFAACGGSTDEDGGGASGSGGASGNGGASGSGGASGNGGASGSGGASGNGGASGSGGSSGAPSCGGPSGAQCPQGKWCNYTPDSCGTADETGVCETAPVGCDFLYAPVCGCDGQVHANDCVAYTAGVDLSANGGCPAPENTFPCGPKFCDATTSYCRKVNDDTGQPPSYGCEPLPTACVGSADCACFPANTPCVEQCEVVFGNGPYGFVLTCLGG